MTVTVKAGQTSPNRGSLPRRLNPPHGGKRDPFLEKRSFDSPGVRENKKRPDGNICTDGHGKTSGLFGNSRTRNSSKEKASRRQCRKNIHQGRSRRASPPPSVLVVNRGESQEGSVWDEGGSKLELYDATRNKPSTGEKRGKKPREGVTAEFLFSGK